MSVACKFERSILSHEEYEAIRLTHHPAIYGVEVAELEAMRPPLAQDARQGADRRPAEATREPRKGRGSRDELSGNRQACVRAKAGVRGGTEAGEHGAQASAQFGSPDGTCRSSSKGPRAAPGRELHDPSLCRSNRKRRHGAEAERTPKKDHCPCKNRTNIAGDESRSGRARRPRHMRPS